MIWNYIFEFYVRYVFGGYIHDTRYDTLIGNVFYNGSWIDGDKSTNYMNGYSFNTTGGGISYIPLGNYLSLIATIITMFLIVFLLICLVRWIFRVVSSAFLLK